MKLGNGVDTQELLHKMGESFKLKNEEMNVEESVECLTAGTGVVPDGSPVRRNFGERIEEIENFPEERTKSTHLKDALAEKERAIEIEKE